MIKESVFIFIPSLHSGGAEKQAVLLAKYLSEDFQTYLVIWNGALYEQKFLDYIQSNAIETYYLEGNLIKRSRKFYKLLKLHKVKYLFCYLASNNFYGSIFGKFAGVKFIIGGIRNSEIPKVKFFLQRFLHNKLLDYTIFNNYSGMESLTKKGFARRKSVVIPNCFELFVEPIIRKNNNIVKIVSLARFVAQKDYLTALKAIQYLKESIYLGKDLNFKYLIIGYGVLETEIRDCISAFQLENDVEIIINPSNTMDYLKSSDIFLTTSLFEGTSNSVMEAMSYSLPIVSTDAGDNKLLIEHNKNGFIIPLKDYKAIAIALSKLINFFELRIKFGEFGYFKLKNEYSSEIFKNRYINFMQSLDEI